AGLSAGIVDQTVFGAAIFVAVATTLLAPPLLVPTFRLAGSGLRGLPAASAPLVAAAETPRRAWTLSASAAGSMAAALDRHLLAGGFRPLVHAEAPGEEVVQYRRDALIFGVELRALDEAEVRLRVEASGAPDAEAVVEGAVRAASAAVAEQLLFSFSAAVTG